MVSTYQQILHHSLQKKWNWYWHQQHWQAQSFPSSTHSQHNILFRIISLHPSTCASASDKSTSCASLRQNTRKAPGPDGISRFCLKACGDQLAPVFTQILSRSLNLCLDFTYYKYWTILLILWDFMTGMMTTGQLLSHRWSQFFKKKVVVVAHWKHFTGPLLDPLLLAPRALTSVNEAVIMHSILQHLLQRVIALYAPFSAQLTDSIPLLPTSLKDRMQQGRLWKFIFCSGIPQGCVFASLLFFLQHKWLHLWGHQSFLRLPTPLPSPYSTLWPQWKIAGLWLNYV